VAVTGNNVIFDILRSEMPCGPSREGVPNKGSSELAARVFRSLSGDPWNFGESALWSETGKHIRRPWTVWPDNGGCVSIVTVSIEICMLSFLSAPPTPWSAYPGPPVL
jgi:hypothetical protein